jgi:hypothetical protein
LDEVIEAYDKRREMLAVAFKIANLSSAQLQARFARATPEGVEALSDLLWKDTEAFIALAEMLADVRDTVSRPRGATGSDADIPGVKVFRISMHCIAAGAMTKCSSTPLISRPSVATNSARCRWLFERRTLNGC